MLAVAEECADIILEEDGLTSIFNCDIYPDLDNPEECVNLAKGKISYFIQVMEMPRLDQSEKRKN